MLKDHEPKYNMLAGGRVLINDLPSLYDLKERPSELPDLVQKLLQSLQDPNRFISYYGFENDLQNINTLRVAINSIDNQDLSTEEREKMLMILLECESRIRVIQAVIIIANTLCTKLNNMMSLLMRTESAELNVSDKSARQKLGRLFSHNEGDCKYGSMTPGQLNIDVQAVTTLFDQHKAQVGLERYSLATVMAAVRLRAGEGTIAEAGHLMQVVFPELDGHEPDLFLSKA